MKIVLILISIGVAMVPACAQQNQSFQRNVERAVTGKIDAVMAGHFSQSQTSSKQVDEKAVQEALLYLATIPLMKPILENLPDNLRYQFSANTPGIASFDLDENSITINPNGIDLNKPQDRLSFYDTLAHELCHANQKKEGLYYNDLAEASFGDTFRVAKMMESETRLLTVRIENELLKRDEFKNCNASEEAKYYQQELKRTHGNAAQANTHFVLLYWQNTKNDTSISEGMQAIIFDRYFFYAEQAYHHALLMHDPKFKIPSTHRTTPVQAMQMYARRMNLKNLDARVFLQNEFDNVQTTADFQDGITILGLNGDKFMALTPTPNPILDKATFFKNNQVDKVFLRHAIAKQMIPIEKTLRQIPDPLISANRFSSSEDSAERIASANLSALEIAIEQGNMQRMENIVRKDPDVINRKTKGSGNFPLLMAIQNDNAQAVRFILGKNPNVLLTTMDGKNVLTELFNLSDTELRQQIESLYAEQKIHESKP